MHWVKWMIFVRIMFTPSSKLESDESAQNWLPLRANVAHFLRYDFSFKTQQTTNVVSLTQCLYTKTKQSWKMLVKHNNWITVLEEIKPSRLKLCHILLTIEANDNSIAVLAYILHENEISFLN